MSRLIVSLVVIVVVLIGALVFFAGRATERPTTRVETPVELNSLAS